MDKRYKLIISNKKIYKEVKLANDCHMVRIGTTKNCEVRFSKELFFDDIELIIENINNTWKIGSGEKTYITFDGVMKLYNKDLTHGDDLLVKYQESNQEVFKISFILDFDFEKKEYTRVIDIGNANLINIGGNARCELLLDDELIGNDFVTLSIKEEKYFIIDNNTKYGVYVNGLKVKESIEIKDYDFFSVIGFSFYLKFGKLYTVKSNKIKINALSYMDINTQTSSFIYPKFNRNARLMSIISDEDISILEPAAIPQKPKSNIVLQMLPALAMVGMVILLKGQMGGNSSFILFSVCSMSIGIVTSVLSIISSKKQYKKDLKDRIEKYNLYIENKRKEIMQIREQETKILNDIYYTLEWEMEFVRDFTGDLFDRSVDDIDFLQVRLGTGAILSSRPVNYKKKETLETEDDISLLPEQVAEEYKYLQNAPIVSKFAKANAIGVVGPKHQLYDVMKNMTLDICIRHYHKDVKLFYIVDSEWANNIEWVRWFQHVNNDDLNVRNLVCDDESKNLLFEYLYVELSRRENAKVATPNVVVFVLNDVGIKLHPLSKYIEKASDFGFTFVFFEHSKELLPQGCSEIIGLNQGESSGYMTYSSDKTKVFDFKYKVVNDRVASEVALRLAPVYCEEVSLEGSLTKNISLFELLSILSVEDLDLRNRWNTSVVYKSMAAPLGVKTKNQVVCLDLHEKAHGPHGLVAGTTGSGKSEILQSYILSMATLFHPYEIGFVIIDFKGGGMVNQFKRLPHLVGAITNIDGREIDRSLQSIKAELQKRQRYFAESGVNHIDNYIMKYKAHEVSEPLPHLIVIVDEFAELKAEQPDFMKELISAARIGRSLGVHLILATQKPSGQVNEQIWSNSKFKLCLKVQTKEDSNEVIKSPLASEIKEPGRTYFQVGNNEIFELFQSAYSGGSAKIDDNGRINEFVLSQVSLSGKRRVVFQQKRNKSDGIVKTQLEDLVDYVADYCEDSKIARLPQICLPPLSEKLEFVYEADREIDMQGMLISLGIYDDPENQYQGLAKVDIASENVMIIGSAQFGKTNLLQVLVRALASQFTPQEVNIYILDFGSMVLKNFEGLNHVGGVVCSTEDEKLKNLLKLIDTEITMRKEKLVAVGVSSFVSYREAGYTDLSKIVIIVDNLTALKELYMQDDDSLLVICREGLAVGISVVIANSQTSGIGYKYLANFSKRVALSCNDSGEYGNVFEHAKIKPKAVAGRCITEINKRLFECQTFLAFDGEREIDRAKEMKLFIEKENAKNPKMKAKMIPEIPKVLSDAYTEKQFSHLMGEDYQVIVGLDYNTVTPVTMDMSNLAPTAICGKEKSGKGNFVTHILRTLEDQKDAVKTEVIIIDDVTKKFAPLKELSIVKQYTMEVEVVEGILTEWEAQLQIRYAALVNGDETFLKQAPLLLLIAQNEDVATTISANVGLLAKYKTIFSKYKALKVGVIFTNVANEPIQYNAPEPLKMIKESRNVVIFEDMGNVKLIEIPFMTIKEFRKPIELGDAYYIKGNDATKIKTVLCTERSDSE